MARLDRHSKQRGRHLGDRPALIAGIAFRGHRGRGTDALNSCRVTGVPEPADKQSHIGALAATVGVQLVQDQEPQTPGRLDQTSIPGAGEDQFQHHVVGQQDVRRVSDDPGPVFRGLLPGITIESHRRAIRIANLQELPQLPQLTVGQGIHRIDDDRLDPRPVCSSRLGRQDPVNDRDDVRKALPGPRPGCQHITTPGARRLDRFTLMLMKSEDRAVGVVVLEPEDPLALRVKQPFGDQVGDRTAGGKVRVERQPGVWPLVSPGHALGNVLADVLVVDVDETAGELTVVVDQPITNPENIHATSRSAALRRLKMMTCLCRIRKHPRSAHGRHVPLNRLIQRTTGPIRTDATGIGEEHVSGVTGAVLRTALNHVSGCPRGVPA